MADVAGSKHQLELPGSAGGRSRVEGSIIVRFAEFAGNIEGGILEHLTIPRDTDTIHEVEAGVAAVTGPRCGAEILAVSGHAQAIFIEFKTGRTLPAGHVTVVLLAILGPAEAAGPVVVGGVASLVARLTSGATYQ